MVSIDASAGGQPFRTSLGLSALLQKPVEITNIRALRPNPGLQAQHLTGLSTIAEICNAELKGAAKHSTSVSFTPKAVHEANLKVNCGTAGSSTLILQSILFPALIKKIKLRITGGTDVSWSPPFYYMQKVLLPVLEKTGARYELKLISHGYFPVGKGIVSFESNPSKLPLKPINLTEQGSLSHIKIFSHCSNLPREVASNQASSAKKTLASLNAETEETIECRENSETTGSGIDIIAYFDSRAILGANALGAKGKPAVNVGKEAAEKLLREINSGKAVDEHLADQLIPFMALAKGCSTIETSVLSEHTLVNISAAEKFLDVKFEVKGEKGKPAEIFVEGAGFKI